MNEVNQSRVTQRKLDNFALSLSLGSVLVLSLVLLDLADECVESLVNMLPRLGASFDERNVEGLGQFLNGALVDGPLRQIAFVPNKNHWNFDAVFNPPDLLAICVNVLEGFVLI